jgi:hypothetical protein
MPVGPIRLGRRNCRCVGSMEMKDVVEEDVLEEDFLAITFM